MHRATQVKPGHCRMETSAGRFVGQPKTKITDDGVLQIKDNSASGFLIAGVTDLLPSSFEKPVSKS